MSETLDLSLLSGSLVGLEREVRLSRLQLDQLAGTVPSRLSAIESRLSAIEQSFYAMAGEMARDFGQLQQQVTRLEKRMDAMDAGLAALRTELADGTARILAALAKP